VVPTNWEELMSDEDPARAHRAMQAMFTMQKIDVATIEAAADGA
jgi:predicted 3-demethylubiquinone-9 3-methyltransferase (glyoxalase superfamily)